MISYASMRTTFVTVTVLFNLLRSCLCLRWKQFNPWSGIWEKWWGAAADSHFWYVERVVCVFFLGGMFWRYQMGCCCFQFTNVHEWGCYNRRVDVGNGRNTWRQSCTLWPPVSSQLNCCLGSPKMLRYCLLSSYHHPFCMPQKKAADVWPAKMRSCQSITAHRYKSI